MGDHIFAECRDKRCEALPIAIVKALLQWVNDGLLFGEIPEDMAGRRAKN